MIRSYDINIAVKNVNTLIEIKIKRHVYVSYPEIREGLISVMKDVRLVDVVDAQDKILSSEAKIPNIIPKT